VIALCQHCGSVLSAVTWECVRGKHCPGNKSHPQPSLPGAVKAPEASVPPLVSGAGYSGEEAA